MIYGVGIDIVKIERVRDIIDRWGDKFLRKVFTEGEISYCHEKKDPYLSFAVRFAAKEAVVKAIGSGVPVSFSDIEVITEEKGRPLIRITGGLEKFFSEKKIKYAHLSLSHEHDYGVAFVVLESQQN